MASVAVTSDLLCGVRLPRCCCCSCLRGGHAAHNGVIVERKSAEMLLRVHLPGFRGCGGDGGSGVLPRLPVWFNGLFPQLLTP